MSERARKKLATSQLLSPMIKQYYADLAAARSKGIPVAWVSSVTPIQILYAMDIMPCMPENYAAALTSRQMGAELSEAAESLGGYNREICSYTRLHIGSMLLKKGAFGDEGLPMPDVLITTKNGCATQVKWWENLSYQLGVPLIVIDTVYRVEESPKEFHINYFINELKEMIAALEFHTGRKMDYTKLEEKVFYASETDKLWARITELRKAKPAPIGPIDVFTNMFPYMVLTGSKQSVDFYKLLLAEVEGLVAQKQGALENEKYRLIWDKFPLWYDLGLINHFEKQGATFVIDAYTNALCGAVHSTRNLDTLLKDPLAFLAARYLDSKSFWKGSQTRLGMFNDLIDEYSVDGMVFHLNRSCRYTSMDQLNIIDQLQNRIPCMTFDGDMADPRSYNPVQVRGKIDAFMEMLSTRKS